MILIKQYLKYLIFERSSWNTYQIISKKYINANITNTYFTELLFVTLTCPDIFFTENQLQEIKFVEVLVMTG